MLLVVFERKINNMNEVFVLRLGIGLYAIPGGFKNTVKYIQTHIYSSIFNSFNGLYLITLKYSNTSIRVDRRFAIGHLSQRSSNPIQSFRRVL